MRHPSRWVVGRILVAAACAIVFRECTYADFERVRRGLRPVSPLSQDGRVSVDLPDLSALGEVSAVLIVDVQNDAAVERTIAVWLDSTSLGQLAVLPGRQRRLAAIVPAAALRHANALALVTNGDGWQLARAQVGNVRGFNEGLLNFVVIPNDHVVNRLPWWHVLAVAGLVMAAARPYALRSRLGRVGWTAAALIAATGLATASISPHASPYRILFAPHTGLLLLALLFAPALHAFLKRALRQSRESIRRTSHVVQAFVRRHVPLTPLKTRDAAVVYLVLLLVLAAASRPRLVGDGPEYLAMARDFARFHWPPADVSRHFWLYSLLAAPFVGVTDRLYLGAPLGFMILNVILLVGAFTVLGTRLGLAPMALLFLGPIVWWMDKVHAEVLMFAALVVASAMLRAKPGWALVALGVAAAQNPAIALLLAAASMVILAMRWARLTDRRFTLAAAIAVGLALLHPVYFYSRLGRATPLLDVDSLRWPTTAEMLVVLIDANVGLLANAPAFVLGVAIAATSFRHRWQTPGESAWAVLAAAILLFSFAQTNNFNHGGTRDMSRYALWLMPLAIPWMAQHASTASARSQRVMQAVALVSAVWSVMTFFPGAPERFLRPTALADALWMKWPEASNPLPEIFVERLAGDEFPWWLPIATAQCEKVLLKGQGSATTMWPARCKAVATPEVCVRPGALCYANRTSGGYAFAEVKPRFPEAFSLHPENLPGH